MPIIGNTFRLIIVIIVVNYNHVLIIKDRKVLTKIPSGIDIKKKK